MELTVPGNVTRRSGRGAASTATEAGPPPRPNADNVVWYVLELDGCHVAVLRDFPLGFRPPLERPRRSDAIKRWVCVGISAVGNRIRCVATPPRLAVWVVVTRPVTCVWLMLWLWLCVCVWLCVYGYVYGYVCMAVCVWLCVCVLVHRSMYGLSVCAQPLQFLHSLDLGLNHLTKIEGLSDLPNLTSLNLHHNSIEDLSGLEACTKLIMLDVSYNRVRSAILAASLVLVLV